MAALTVAGDVRVPGDKSISHRALMLAALATGESRVRGVLESADVHSTAGVLRALGAAVPSLGPTLRIAGSGLHGLRAAAVPLDCGNSGTTTRLMAGICAGYAFESMFIGDASLARRPMRRIARPLEAMGAQVTLTGDALPMTVRGGALRSIDWVNEKSSAQVKSAILLAGIVGGVAATVREPEPSRDHSERMLRAAGVSVVTGEDGAVTIAPTASLRAIDIEVPGDPSSAAFFAALAVLAAHGELHLRGVGLNPTRTGFYAALRRMGAGIRFEDARDQGGEPVGTIVASASAGELRATTAQGAEIPSMIDELPLLACVAARASGTTEIRGAAELRVKESDRIAAVVANLRTLGAEAEELPDGLRVTGSDRPLRGRAITHGDHRLAMAFGILGAVPGNSITVDDPGCAIVSFPGFWELLGRVTAHAGGGEGSHGKPPSSA